MPITPPTTVPDCSPILQRTCGRSGRPARHASNTSCRLSASSASALQWSGRSSGTPLLTTYTAPTVSTLYTAPPNASSASSNAVNTKLRSSTSSAASSVALSAPKSAISTNSTDASLNCAAQCRDPDLSPAMTLLGSMSASTQSARASSLVSSVMDLKWRCAVRHRRVACMHARCAAAHSSSARGAPREPKERRPGALSSVPTR
mmetsp:Transcript_13971/g.33481  ORF Transcript_13971/g.33481 Transcript_13971/m.33481 type:complete len:204 (+) Transcript_13971:291-902(+)